MHQLAIGMVNFTFNFHLYLGLFTHCVLTGGGLVTAPGTTHQPLVLETTEGLPLVPGLCEVRHHQELVPQLCQGCVRDVHVPGDWGVMAGDWGVMTGHWAVIPGHRGVMGGDW